MLWLGVTADTMMNITESDWKKFRRLKEEKLNAYCDSVLASVETIFHQGTVTPHQTYLAVWKQLTKSDEKLVEMFDDIRRSNAILKLTSWRYHQLISDEEMSQFSESTQQTVKRFNDIQSRREESNDDNG